MRPDRQPPSPGSQENAHGAIGSKVVLGQPLEVIVDERGLERAIRVLARKAASEGVSRELKRRRHYEKPSVRKRRKARTAEKRRRRALSRLRPPQT